MLGSGRPPKSIPATLLLNDLGYRASDLVRGKLGYPEI
jgi:hypothetical protein